MKTILILISFLVVVAAFPKVDDLFVKTIQKRHTFGSCKSSCNTCSSSSCSSSCNSCIKQDCCDNCCQTQSTSSCQSCCNEYCPKPTTTTPHVSTVPPVIPSPTSSKNYASSNVAVHNDVKNSNQVFVPVNIRNENTVSHQSTSSMSESTRRDVAHVEYRKEEEKVDQPAPTTVPEPVLVPHPIVIRVPNPPPVVIPIPAPIHYPVPRPLSFPCFHEIGRQWGCSGHGWWRGIGHWGLGSYGHHNWGIGPHAYGHWGGLFGGCCRGSLSGALCHNVNCGRTGFGYGGF